MFYRHIFSRNPQDHWYLIHWTIWLLLSQLLGLGMPVVGMPVVGMAGRGDAGRGDAGAAGAGHVCQDPDDDPNLGDGGLFFLRFFNIRSASSGFWSAFLYLLNPAILLSLAIPCKFFIVIFTISFLVNSLPDLGDVGLGGLVPPPPPRESDGDLDDDCPFPKTLAISAHNSERVFFPGSIPHFLAILTISAFLCFVLLLH